jgi:hypothetical protein
MDSADSKENGSASAGAGEKSAPMHPSSASLLQAAKEKFFREGF